MHIYIVKNGTKTGPYSEEQVRGMLTGGLVSVDDSAWREGAADWQPLHALLGLKQPPPIPTAAPPVVAQPKQIIGQPPQLLTRMPIPVQDTPAASSNHPSSHNPNPTEPKQTWSEIVDRLQPNSPSVKTRPKQATSSQATAPVKVGGWLLFFCVVLTLVPLSVFSQWAAFWKEGEPTFASFPAIETSMILCFFVSVALRSYGFIVGIMIWAGNTRGREIAKRFLIVYVVSDVGAVVIALLIIKDLPSSIFDAFATDGFDGMLGGFICCITWWFYFKKSKRVRDTYGPETPSLALQTNAMP